MYVIKPDEAERPNQVWCEQDIDNGGWTVIQSRRDGSVNFFRNWDNYKVMTRTVPLLPFSPFLFSLSKTTVVLLYDHVEECFWLLGPYSVLESLCFHLL